VLGRGWVFLLGCRLFCGVVYVGLVGVVWACFWVG
jgi:hypothetical protein